MKGGRNVYYIGNLAIFYNPMSPRESGSEIQKWSSPDSVRRGGAEMRKERVGQLWKE